MDIYQIETVPCLCAAGPVTPSDGIVDVRHEEYPTCFTAPSQMRPASPARPASGSAKGPAGDIRVQAELAADALANHETERCGSLSGSVLQDNLA